MQSMIFYIQITFDTNILFSGAAVQNVYGVFSYDGVLAKAQTHNLLAGALLLLLVAQTLYNSNVKMSIR